MVSARADCSVRVLVFVPAFALAVMASAAQPVHAAGLPLMADAGPGDNIDAARTFAPDFYQTYRPRTALDMALKTPGFKLQLGSAARGLDGALGNVLINGVRPPAKAAPVTELLAAIPASDVKTIMLVPAGVMDVDMGGHALLLYVVTATKAGIEGSVSAGTHDNGPSGVSGNAKAEMRISRARRLVTMNAHASRSRSESRGRLIAPLAGQTTARQAGGTQAHNGSERFSTMAQWQPSADGDVQVRVNVSQTDGNSQPSRREELPDAMYSTSASASRAGDIAADVQWPLAVNRAALSLTTLLSRHQSRSVSRLETSQGSRDSTSDSSRGESAVRAAFRWKASETWSLQTGADHAQNFLEGGLRYRINGEDVAVPGADSRVEEVRSGMFTTLSWQPRKDWNWEAGLRGETSALVKSGEGQAGVHFSDLLPRVAMTWLPGADSRVQGGIERHVGQLAFSQFLASVGLADDIVTAGAQALVPESSWRYSLDYEYRIGTRGLFNMRASRKDTDNPIDMVVLANGLQAMANVASTVVDTVETQLSAPLDRIGLPGGLLSISKSESWFRGADPVTGEPRPVSTPGNASVSLRQELPSGKGAWGLSLSDGTESTFYGVNQVTRAHGDATGSAFGQWRPHDSLLVRVGYSTGRKSSRESWLFDGVRVAGAVAGLRYHEASSSPPAWDAKVEWEPTHDYRMELGVSTASSTQYISRTLSSSGETIERSTLIAYPAITTNIHWRW